MPVIAVLPDQDFRRCLLAATGLPQQLIRRYQNRGSLRRHVVGCGAFQNVADLFIQGPVVPRCSLLESLHHTIAK